VELATWLNAKQKWGWEHDPRKDDGLSDNFDCNEGNYRKEGEDAQPKEFVFPMNYFYQLPLAPNSSKVPLAPILGTSPKLNLKLNLESNHVLEAPTTM
jgi:hypothetical protein